MPVYFFAGGPNDLSLTNTGRCSRNPKMALAEAKREHGDVVEKGTIPRPGYGIDNQPLKPYTVYHFADGVRLVFVGYAGVC